MAAASLRVVRDRARDAEGASALVAANIVKLRDARLISAATLAALCGWPVARIEAIERGAGEALCLDDIDTLAKALQVSPAALFA